MGKWTAEVTNDPDRDYNLYVEILEDEEYRARLFQDDEGVLQLCVYDGKNRTIPVDWLLGIIRRFQEELTAMHDDSE
jgi:hypothetical protein